MQFVERRSSYASIGYNSRPAYSSPLSCHSTTYSDPPSSPPSLASSSSTSSGMSSSSPFRGSEFMVSTSEGSDSFQRRRQAYKSNVPSRRSRQASSPSPRPQERFRRQTAIRIHDDRTKIVNSKRNGCGRDAIRTGLETAEELAILRKMWIGDAQERTLQADPELNQMWQMEEIQAQIEEGEMSQEPYLDVIYEEDDALELLEQYKHMPKEADNSSECLSGAGRPEPVHYANDMHLITDVDMDIEDYLSDDSIFEAALQQSKPAFSEQAHPETVNEGNSMDMQE